MRCYCISHVHLTHIDLNSFLFNPHFNWHYFDLFDDISITIQYNNHDGLACTLLHVSAIQCQQGMFVEAHKVRTFTVHYLHSCVLCVVVVFSLSVLWCDAVRYSMLHYTMRSNVVYKDLF